ncbi:MAG TPA: hypothetical protein VLI04_01600 [Nocardioidaceae bacterium]|nr:hypothetical protein [Nocardioidaceae bacterium]
MNPLALLGGLLAYNYRRHLAHESTICSTGRALLPKPVATIGLLVGFGWLLPHVRRAYPRT